MTISLCTETEVDRVRIFRIKCGIPSAPQLANTLILQGFIVLLANSVRIVIPAETLAGEFSYGLVFRPFGLALFHKMKLDGLLQLDQKAEKEKDTNGPFSQDTSLGSWNMEESREKAYRFVAYTAIALSLVSVVSTCLTLPMIHVYFASVRMRTDASLRLCRLSAQELLEEAQLYRKYKKTDLAFISNRTALHVKRQAGGCGECCLPGTPGPPGKPGRNGKPGKPGAQGPPGFLGLPPLEICGNATEAPCKTCPPGVPGEPGAQGPPGSPGQIGEAGEVGNDGEPGAKGPPGEGPPGTAGNPGLKGDPGSTPSANASATGDPGPAGLDGSPGPPGQPGQRGVDGHQPPSLPGPRGQPGKAGPDGGPGDKGPAGDSGHAGEPGACPKYCAIDGGIFFFNGTRRFLSFSVLENIWAQHALSITR